MDIETKNRFNILTWAIGIVGALTIAELGMIFTMWQSIAILSYQIGQVSGELTTLLNHITLK